MKILLLLFIFPLTCLACPKITSRTEWNARPPKNGQYQCMTTVSKNILIHHTAIPKTCFDQKTCKNNMKSMQAFHQDERKWPDIAYNFCIGGDGEVYEGRGWGVVGYPAHGYEFNSTGICLIGDFSTSMPSEKMLQATINLIECGINNGFIDEDVRVKGIREVIATQSPGNTLQDYIEKTRFGYPRNSRHVLMK